MSRNEHALQKQRIKQRISRGWSVERAETLPRSPGLYRNDKAVDWESIFDKVWAEVNESG